MRKAIIILCFGFALAACSNGEVDSTSKNDGTKSASEEGLQKQEKKESQITLTETEEKKANDEQNEQANEKKAEEESWQGEWIFTSDDTLGQLHIEQGEGNQILYKLTGTSIGDTSYANAFEGTGTIKGNELEFTDSLVEGCGGVMKKSGTMITFTIENENCHTQRVYLDGDYLKEDSIETSPLLTFENGQFNVYGIALGDTPSQTKKRVGNPTYEGPDEEGFYEWMQEYPSRDLLVTYTPDKKVESIHAQEGASESNGAVDLAKGFVGERYSDGEGSTYLYNPDNGQLLLLNQNGPSVSFFVTYADGNFHQGVENGLIKPE